MILRDYQQEAVDFLLPLRRGFIQAPAGAGKTFIASTAAATKAKSGWKVTWLANTREQVDQGIAAIEKTEGPAGVEFDVCCVAAAPDVSDSDIIVIDECFPGGTLVDGKPIETLRPGDMVSSFNHRIGRPDTREIKQVFARGYERDWIRVTVAGQKSFVCTEGHPVYVVGAGYIPAGRLSMMLNSDPLSSYELLTLRKSTAGTDDASASLIQVLQPTLLPRLQPGPPPSFRGGSAAVPGMQGARALPESFVYEPTPLSGLASSWEDVLLRGMQAGLDVKERRSRHVADQPRAQGQNLRAHEAPQSDANQGELREYAGRVDGEAYALPAGRERAGDDGTASDAAGFDWADCRVCGIDTGAHSPGALRSGPVPLQNRPGRNGAEARRRDRRDVSQDKGGAETGPQEGHRVEAARLVSVEVYKRGSAHRPSWVPSSDTVYNLHVAGNENYFVEGCLVHNCHHAPASTWAALIGQAKPDAIIWGFSATPWSGDTQRDEFLEQTFENFFIVERERVEESGHLIKGKVYVHDLDIPGQWDAEIEQKVLTEVEKRFRQYPILRDNMKCMGLTSRIKSLKNKLLLKLGSAKYQQAATGQMLEADAAALGVLEALQQLAQTITERDSLVKKEHRARAQWQITQEYLQANETRNSAVVQLATSEAAAGESVLVLVHSIEHGEGLAARIPGAKLVHSKVGAKSRRELIDAFRVGTLRVLFATSLADEGLDVPRASRLILVSGGRSAGKLEQRAGRVLRPHAGKNGGIIHDFKDQGMMFAHAQAKARFKVYDKLGYSPEIVSYREKAFSAA